MVDSPYPVNLFTFSYPEGNKLLDCSINLSHQNLSLTNNLLVNIATSLHENVPLSSTVHRLWDAAFHVLAKATLKITVGCTLKITVCKQTRS